MNTRQWIVLIIAACAVGAASYSVSNALSSRRALESGGCIDPGMTPVVSYLRLTAEQENQIRPIDERFRRNQAAACRDMQDARDRLLDTLRQPNTRKADLDSALDDVARAQAAQQRLTAEYLLEIKPHLSDDQRERLFGVVGQRFCGQGQCGAGACPGGGMGPGRRLGRPW